MQKGIITVLVIGIIVLIGTTVYFATLNKVILTVTPAPKIVQQATPAPAVEQSPPAQADNSVSATPIPANESINQTYINDEYRFSFTYPDTWKMVTAFQASEIDYLPDSRNFVAIYPDQYPNQDLSARVDVYNVPLTTVKRDNPFVQNLSSSTTTVNGISWTKMGDIDYLTEKDGKTYSVSGREDLISQIVSTFKFTK